MKKFLVGAGVVAAGVLLMGAPSQAAEKADSCAAYALYQTDTNICDLYPGSKDRDCADIKEGRVFVAKKGVDPWRLDRDGNSIGCETADKKAAAPAPAKDDKDVLPKTGPGIGLVAAGGALLAGTGGALVLARRRKVRFTA